MSSKRSIETAASAHDDAAAANAADVFTTAKFHREHADVIEQRAEAALLRWLGDASERRLPDGRRVRVVHSIVIKETT